MSKKIDRKRLDDLEIKWTNGTISEEEEKEYNDWFENGNDQTIIIPPFVSDSKENHKNKIFQRILRTIEGSEPQNAKKKFYNLKHSTLLRAAAIIGICSIIGGSYFYLSNEHHRKNKKDSIVDIQPGHNSMHLIFSNGESVMLDTLKSEIVGSDAGVIIKNINGILSYSGLGLNSLYNTAVTEVRQKYHIILPDSSQIWLNAGSSIKYPLSFGSKSREVFLKGEAYFEVTHNEKHPFIVKTEKQTIQVLGTHFVVTAYDEDTESTVTLVQGKVRVSNGKISNILSPGEMATINKMNNIQSINAADTASVKSWIDNKFSFDNCDIETIMKKLKRWYGIDVNYEKGVDLTKKYFGKTNMNQNLSEVLKVLELADIHFKQEEKIITILP